MYAAIANFSGIEEFGWLTRAYRMPDDAVVFFECKESAVKAVSNCPPLNVSFSYRLTAYTPEAIRDETMYNSTAYPIKVDGSVRGFLFRVTKEETRGGRLDRMGIETVIEIERGGNGWGIVSVKCNSYYRTSWNLHSDLQFVCLEKRDERVEFSVAGDNSKIPNFPPFPNMVVSRAAIPKIDLVYWIKATCLVFSDKQVSLAYWVRFPVRLEDKSEIV